MFEARGLSNFAGLSSAPDALTDNGHDTSYGAGLKLGVQVPFAETWSFGASYQTKIWMSEFDDYAGLFAEGGDFDIPSTATIGVAGKATDALTIAFDVQWIGYGDIASISNPVLPNFFSSQLGLDDGGGFGWENMTVYKLGFAYDTSDSSTWRFGVSTTEQPVGSDDVLLISLHLVSWRTTIPSDTPRRQRVGTDGACPRCMRHRSLYLGPIQWIQHRTSK